MLHEKLDYQSPATVPNGWHTGDSVFVVFVLVYAAFNVVLMLMYANNMLGPVPFSLIFLLLRISASGVIAAFPIQLLLRRFGVTWRSAVAVVVCFIGLSGFNFWCLAVASAAV